MDERNDIMGMLDLMVCPGFCVKNQKKYIVIYYVIDLIGMYQNIVMKN